VAGTVLAESVPACASLGAVAAIDGRGGTDNAMRHRLSACARQRRQVGQKSGRIGTSRVREKY